MTRHRGNPASDAAAFSGPRLERLRRAAEEAAWLLDRGYPRDRVLSLCGDRHRLIARQRLALNRALCSAAELQARKSRELSPEAVRGAHLHIDGFNLVITLEVALVGGAVVSGRDGTLRDLAGLRGGYHPVAETAQALELTMAALARLQPASVRWLFDAPVSNSGRLCQCVRDASQGQAWQTEALVVPDPDRDLVGLAGVVSSDSVVLDRCQSWFNLTRWLLAELAPQVGCIALP